MINVAFARALVATSISLREHTPRDATSAGEHTLRDATSAGTVQKTVVLHLARPTAFTKLLFARIKGSSNAGLSAPGEKRAPIELSACAADYYELIN